MKSIATNRERTTKLGFGTQVAGSYLITLRVVIMNIDNMFGLLESSINLRSQRAEIIASNIANADTPGFKARDIEFSSILEGLSHDDTMLNETHSNHLPLSNGLSEFEIKYRTPLQSSRDGNTVETNVENAAFSENSVQYMASLRFMDNHIKGILTALRGE